MVGPVYRMYITVQLDINSCLTCNWEIKATTIAASLSIPGTPANAPLDAQISAPILGFPFVVPYSD